LHEQISSLQRLHLFSSLKNISDHKFKKGYPGVEHTFTPCLLTHTMDYCQKGKRYFKDLALNTIVSVVVGSTCNVV